MTRPVVAVLGTRYQDLSIEAAVLGPYGVELRTGTGADRAGIVAVAADADVILAASLPRFDAATIGQLSCRGIVRYGVGTESIDLDAAQAGGIWVARVADYGTEAVATHAVALALAAARRLRGADQRVRGGSWEFASLRPMHLPSAATVGVLGFGRIGQHAARQFIGVGYRVIAHDPYLGVEGRVPGVSAVSGEDLLARSDILSLHLPGRSDGRPVIDAAALAKLKPEAILVNTSRGSLVDFTALLAGLRTGRPAFAALDVLPAEPPDPTWFEGTEDALLLSPHMAWYTEESEADLRRKAAMTALQILRGERPVDVVVEGRARHESIGSTA